NISCNGGSNGAASINTPTGGAGGYTYNWTPGNPTGDGTVSVTGLAAGTWTCTVTDANSCTATQTFNITQPTAITASISSTPTSCTANTGTATVSSVSGGAGGYTYSWAPTGGTAATATGLGAGNYTCTITDANTCSITRTVNVTTVSGPSLTAASQTNVICFGGNNGAASVNPATGGTSPYTYNWTPGNPTGDGTVSVTGLIAGTWTCTVTDAAGCTATATFNITQPPALTVSPASQTNVSCFGGNNGAASVTVSGGAGGYTYNWTPGNPTGDGTVSVTGLAAGTWTCTVTDANACTATQTFNITSPTAIVVTPASQTNILCNGITNGAASINTPTGGAGGYTYNWTPGNPLGDGTTSVTALAAGTWTCTVTDANSCTATQTFNITQPAALVVSAASQTNISCNGGSNGAASVNVSGGTTLYTYNWTPGNPTGDGTASVTGLIFGTYTCTVTDANSCIATQTFNITQPTPVILTASSQTNISCFGGSNGAASVAPATGGTPGYTYNWTPGNPTGDGTVSVTGLTAGTWTCTVTDANSCTATRTFTITSPPALVVTPASQTNVSCFGGSNGAASINTPTGGAGGYTYNWTPGNPTGDGTVSVTGLAAGTWTCTVTDANSCTATQTFNITSPSALVVTPASQTNISCNGGSNGAASINTPTGGAGGYTYNWTPGNPTGDGTVSVTGLTAGTWTCTVTDANSCTATQTFNITQPTAITASISSTTTACTSNTGTATVSSVSGGAGGYTYSWAPSGGTAATATGLGAGNYTCTITDANTCSITRTVNVTTVSGPSLTAASQTNISCFGGNTGAASVNPATGGTSPYTYNWTPGNPTGDGTVSVTGLIAGSWTCTVTDAAGCTATATFNITQPPAITVNPASQTNVSCFGGNNGAASVTVSGGSGGYTYNWTPGNPTGDGTVS
ncbi:MAG: beta strand repeat-containing protein, partial [Bacteroidota bacterium]